MKLILLIALAIVATANAGSLRYTNEKKMLSTLDKVDRVLNKEINALSNAESHRFQTDNDVQPATATQERSDTDDDGKKTPKKNWCTKSSCSCR
jgi:hypothetical protein